VTARRAPRGSPGAPGVAEGGFTLLEVLVALAILGIAVVASIQGFAQGLRLLKLSGDHQRAILLADQKAREIVEFEEGRQEGVEGEFRWERTTTLLPVPELTPPSGGDPDWRVWQIAVRVNWDERRHVDVATLRTLPRQPQTALPTTSGSSPGPPRRTSGARP
jgi:general secretion pathway protein I